MAQEKACEIPTIPRVDMLDVARKGGTGGCLEWITQSPL